LIIADGVDCDKVIVDDFNSALNAAAFNDLGCKISLFSSVDNLSVGKLRTDGYLKALENNNFCQ
jgi:LacI family transcriptional regulator